MSPSLLSRSMSPAQTPSQGSKKANAVMAKDSDADSMKVNTSDMCVVSFALLLTAHPLKPNAWRHSLMMMGFPFCLPSARLPCLSKLPRSRPLAPRRTPRTNPRARKTSLSSAGQCASASTIGAGCDSWQTETATYFWNAVLNLEDEKGRLGHMVIFAFTGGRHIRHVDIVVPTRRVSSMSRGWSRFGSWVSVLDKRNGVLR
ncbi:hypothetical protein BKA56DRAFT_208537 [Ilyonectria sp. MPI-CAGE-AT-0026]|nr:hypothetical protein BKA56DRAFT_208537 [Ilyonectria sp. MPI-CAGE-AT-0026]